MTFAFHNLLAYQVNGSTNVEACGRERGPPIVAASVAEGSLMIMQMRTSLVKAENNETRAREVKKSLLRRRKMYNNRHTTDIRCQRT
jgi:hypothetical protein